jgi:hypothetical protein
MIKNTIYFVAAPCALVVPNKVITDVDGVFVINDDIAACDAVRIAGDVVTVVAVVDDVMVRES